MDCPECDAELVDDGDGTPAWCPECGFCEEDDFDEDSDSALDWRPDDD